MGHFVSSPRERKKRYIRNSRDESKEIEKIKGKENDRGETEKIKMCSLPHLLVLTPPQPPQGN